MEIQELLAALHSTDSAVQRTAVYELSELHAKIAVPEIIPLLTSPDDSLRSLSAGFLGAVAEIGDSRVGDHLIPLLNDNDELVRSEAAVALGLIQYRQAIPALKNTAQHDPEWIVRDNAVEALDYFHDIALFPLFQTVLAHDEEVTVARDAADAIYTIVEPEHVAIIQQDIAANQEEPVIIVRLIFALYKLGVADSLNQFFSLLQTVEDYDTIFSCLNSLTRVIKGQIPPHIIADFPRIAVALDDLAQRMPDTHAYRDELKARFQQIQVGNVIPADGCC